MKRNKEDPIFASSIKYRFYSDKIPLLIVHFGHLNISPGSSIIILKFRKKILADYFDS